MKSQSNGTARPLSAGRSVAGTERTLMDTRPTGTSLENFLRYGDMIQLVADGVSGMSN
jgi:hypothetical protein